MAPSRPVPPGPATAPASDGVDDGLPSDALSNRRLRTVDWRVLLPDPRPRRIAVASSGGAADGFRALDAVTVTELDRVDAGGADLVLLGEEIHRVGQAAEALRPGGYVVLELRRATGSKLRRIRRALAGAAFLPPSLHAPILDRSSGVVRAWLPVERSGAFEYFLRWPEPIPGVRGWIRQRLRRVAWHGRVRGLLPVDLVAIARSSAPAGPEQGSVSAGGRGMSSRPIRSDANHSPEAAGTDLRSAIEVAARAAGVVGRDQRTAVLLLTPGESSLNKIVGLIFAGGDPTPAGVVKLPRVDASIATLRNEAAVLTELGERGAGAAPGLPGVLFTLERCGVPVVGQRYLAGRSLAALVRREPPARLAALGTAWLQELAATCGGAARDPAMLVASTLAEFGATFGSVLEPHLLERSAELLATLPVLPTVPEQRDFAPWNLRVDDRTGGLNVLDWESGLVEGLPLLDLVYFLSYLGFYVDRADALDRYIECYRRYLDAQQGYGSLVADCTRSYLRGLGLPMEIVGPLRVLTWMIHSRSEFARIGAPPGSAAHERALREALFPRLWREEVLHSMQARGRAP